MLSLFLQFGDDPIELPVLKMLTGLTIKVLVPTLIGHVLRPWLQNAVKQYTVHISVFNQLIVLLIILNAVSSSTTRILQAGQVLFLVFFFMLCLHLSFLFINQVIARLICLDLPSTAAFTIHNTQKALTIAYLVWAGYFAVEYPMALIPAITYHLTQMFMGTIVAHRFRKKAEFADVHP
jgi:sodium/bile acid cotransporter 7